MERIEHPGRLNSHGVRISICLRFRNYLSDSTWLGLSGGKIGETGGLV